MSSQFTPTPDAPASINSGKARRLAREARIQFTPASNRGRGQLPTFKDGPKDEKTGEVTRIHTGFRPASRRERRAAYSGPENATRRKLRFLDAVCQPPQPDEVKAAGIVIASPAA